MRHVRVGQSRICRDLLTRVTGGSALTDEAPEFAPPVGEPELYRGGPGSVGGCCRAGAARPERLVRRVGRCQDPAPGSLWESSIMLPHGSRKNARRRLMASISKG